MIKRIKIADRWIGTSYPTFIVAEIGINHNGDLDLAKELIDAAIAAGCDAVKFQKRTPALCVPEDQRHQLRETPWGYISNFEYRQKMEFTWEQFHEIDCYCRDNKILWFASCWDRAAVDCIQQFNPCCFKIPSACLTDHGLLRHMRAAGKPLILSTGMSTMAQIHSAVGVTGLMNLILCHSTSSSLCTPSELNLARMRTLDQLYPCPIGYSSREVGPVPLVAAVSLGACLVERPITLDRALWGSDQVASMEPDDFKKLTKYIRIMEPAVGDGIKRAYKSEKPAINLLRRVKDMTKTDDAAATNSLHSAATPVEEQDLLIEAPVL